MFIYFIVAGVLAGIVSVIASMASLVSYPALLFAGLSPVVANMTNTASLITTGFGAAASSFKELKGHWEELAKYCLFGLTGAALGGWLLIAFPGDVFKKLVPFFVIFSAIMLLISGRRETFQGHEKKSKFKRILAFCGLFVAGVYAGYFGAAAGVLMLIFITYLSDDSFVVINAMKNLLGSLANLVALLIFLYRGLIRWDVAIPLAIGLFVGGYIGQSLVKYMKPSLVRWITAFFSVILAGYLFYTAY